MTIDPDRVARVEDLLGRRVRAQDGSVVGRIEDIRAEKSGEDEYEVIEYHLGTRAFFERLGLISGFLGGKPRLRIARWDQLDITDPLHPRLTCPPAELIEK